MRDGNGMLALVGTRAELMRAQRDQTAVGIVRSLKHADAIEGFIVGVGESWGVIQGTREAGHFDGYAAFRLKDVKKVRRRASHLVDRFARTLSTWPPRSPGALALGSAESLVRSMAAASSLVGIQQEGNFDAVWIGEVEQADSRWIRLMEVNPDGSWDDVRSRYKTKQITLVTIDNMYQQALAVVAGSRK